MLKNIKTISNKLLAIGIIVAVLIVVLVGFDIYQKNKQKSGLTDNHILKAPKEKIINYEVKKQNDNNNIVVYHYVSNKEVPPETYQGLEEDLSKRTPSSQTFLKSITPIDDKNSKEEYIGKFYTSATFQQDGDKWYQIETATTTPVAFVNQTKLTVLDKVKEFFGQKVLADTFYAGTGDGYSSYRDGVFATAHDATTGNSTDYTNTSSRSRVERRTGPLRVIERAFLPFDTSSLDDGATIISASLSIYLLTVTNSYNDGYDYLNIVHTFQASNTSIDDADYEDCGSDNDTAARAKFTPIQTGAASLDITGLSASSWTSFTLNSTGINWISKTGYTNFGIRVGNDLENVDVVGGNFADANGVSFYTSEQTDVTNDPYLTVSYTVIAPTVLKIDGGRVKIDGGRLKIN